MRKIFPVLLMFTIAYAIYFYSIGEPLFSLNNKVFAESVIYLYEDTPIYIELANTEQKRVLGLSGRDIMTVSQGMLFKFDESSKWSIWMKDMNFGIDILWLDKDGRVVDMREFVYPDTYPELFTPQEDAKYILEVLSGFSSMHGVYIGHKLNLNGL